MLAASTILAAEIAAQSGFDIVDSAEKVPPVDIAVRFPLIRD
jgi:hypothetical protein